MNKETYNGWTNWDTWNANLRLTNDEGAYNYAKHCVDERSLEHTFKELFYSTERNEYIDGINPDKVNWLEIYEGLHE